LILPGAYSKRAPQRGLTLIELLIALALGMVVSAAIFTVFVSSSRSAREDEQYRLMMESGRYGLNLLRDEIRMVDFWGALAFPDDITTILLPNPGSCAAALGLLDPEQALLVNDGDVIGSTPQFAACNAMTANQVVGTDMLVIKRVARKPTARTLIDRADLDGDGDTGETLQLGYADLQAGVAYLRTSATDGRIISDSSSANPPALGESDWALETRAYFVRDHFRQAGDGIPSLCRLSVVGVELGNVETSAANQAECIVPGIEDFNIEFGLDNNNDGVPDEHSTVPTVAEMERAVSARVYVLARANQQIATYQNAKIYQMGTTITSGPFNDGFYRSLFTTAVALRNPTNLSRLR
jgi:type IV pilus assembly protein PilW